MVTATIHFKSSMIQIYSVQRTLYVGIKLHSW